MDSLIKRLQEAESGSRELVALIAIAIGGYSMWKSKHGYWNINGPDGERLTCEGRDPGLVFDPATGARLAEESPPMSWICDAEFGEVTTSLDAIVALIGEKLPGWGVTIRMELAPYVQTCELCAPDDPNAALTDPRPFRTSGGANTAPLACCIALLTALQSQEPTP